MPSPALRFLPAVLLAAAGAALAIWIVPLEALAVEEHLLGFPDSETLTLELRPVVLAALCLLPAVAALFYALADSLDRYLARQMLGAVGICALALVVVWLLLDVNDNIDKFLKAEDGPAFLLRYYAVALPPVFVLLVPFALMLGLLYCLGRLSHSREIIAMIQTGRGVVRVIAPLGAVGFFLSLSCLFLNYHWAPWGEGYKHALIEEAKSGSASQARNILYYHPDSGRVWMVGSFPYNYTRDQPLREVEIRTKGKEGRPATVLKAPLASWNADNGAWIFQDAELLDLRAVLGDEVEMPKFQVLPSPHIITDFPETPWQIVKPGLKEEYLGIPELQSWLKENRDKHWAPRRAYLTQWHYRWAQPWLCLVVILLAAPLGIVFTRRGAAGGIAIAVFLSAGMLIAAEISLSLGDAGYFSPALAAWGTNLVFTLIALALLYRRLRGRPIYQSIMDHIPLRSEG